MIFRRIGRAIRRAVDVGKDIFNTAKRTVSDIIKKPLEVAGRVLDKIPIPKVIRGFAEKFLNSPLAGLLPGPIAGVAAMLAQAKTAGDVLDIVRGVTGSQAFAAGPPAARNNVLELAAAQHARVMFPHMFN
jgi:hypothetical protein